MCVSDLIKVDDEGKILEGEGLLNQAAFAIHSRIHKARPDVVAAAHAHSLYGKAWSSLGRLLDPLTQDACARTCRRGCRTGWTHVSWWSSSSTEVTRLERTRSVD
jgi:ribulose-5-phosphate 4-epimerase/fuculose-1-phosphate aldolase